MEGKGPVEEIGSALKFESSDSSVIIQRCRAMCRAKHLQKRRGNDEISDGVVGHHGDSGSGRDALALISLHEAILAVGAPAKRGGATIRRERRPVDGYTSRVDALWNLDNALFRAVNVGWHQPWLDPVFWAFSYSGLGQVQALIILSLWFCRPLRGWIAPLLTTVVVSGFFIGDVLKHLIPRDRPSNLPFAIVQEDLHFHSFPSGHTCTSFGIAIMLILLTRGTSRAWLGWAALLWACGVGVSRIYRGVHWPTDVLGGICVGLAGSILVWSVFNWKGWLPERAEATRNSSPVEGQPPQ